MARSRYKRRMAGFVIKALGSLVIIAILGILVWRMIDSNNDPKAVDTITPNDRLVAAYEEKGKDLNIYYQEHTKYTRGENNYGYFSITQSIIIDDIDQIQFVFRYNNSTLEHTKNDYKLTSTPSRNAKVYDVTLTVMYDLTPDDKTDNDGSNKETVEFKRFFPSDCVSAQKTLYNYRRYTFDGIEIDDTVLAVYADFYYVGDINYEEDAYGSLLVYYYEEECIDYKLTRKDIKAIEAYLKD